MTVSAAQIAKAKATGLENVPTAARVCDETGTKFYHLCALLEKETNGRNIYGHDKGGAMNGFPGTVNKDNYAVFRWMVDVGVPIVQPDGTVKIVKFKTNGVGPLQLTWKGFHVDMESKGLKVYESYDSVTYGAKLFTSYYRAARDIDGLSVNDSIRKAGTRYNNSASYGDRLLTLMIKWKQLVGDADYA